MKTDIFHTPGSTDFPASAGHALAWAPGIGADRSAAVEVLPVVSPNVSPES